MSQINQNYEEINQILKRVSNRTLEMKTNNIKLLNKIGSEMNMLLAKAQEIVRFCISDRNEFMKEIELIQFDFIELGKKIDQQSMREEDIKLKQTLQTQTQKSKSNLISMLDSDGSDNENSNHGPSSSLNHLAIPDTCIPQLNSDKITKPSRQLIIRDTIDSNFDEIFKQAPQDKLKTINENSLLNESLEKESDLSRNLDETCLEDFITEKNPEVKKVIPDTSRVHFLKTSQSTPLAIKKKLQEHGLLDLTNSPHETPQKNKKTISPVKYVQSKFVLESPKNQTNSNVKTPVKIVLKTPTKSPSIFMKKFNYQPNSEISSDCQEKSLDQHQNDSFDFSFEFREQAKTKISNSSKTINSNNPLRNSLSNSSVYSSNSNKSPKSKVTQNNRSKRFKQITIDDIDSKNVQENKISNFFTRKESDKSLLKKNNSDNLNFDETCLPNDNIFNNVRIKQEKISDYKSNSNSNSSDYNEAELQGQNERAYKNLADEYFNDFDKVPKRKEVNQGNKNFKHVEVVRKHDERKKLPTWSCKECETYWNSVPEEMRPKRMEESCRHRAKYQAPPTPEHYWSVAFPTTQECIERGYGGVVAQNDKDDDIGKRPRRKRPLKLVAPGDKNDEDLADLDFGD